MYFDLRAKSSLSCKKTKILQLKQIPKQFYHCNISYSKMFHVLSPWGLPDNIGVNPEFTLLPNSNALIFTSTLNILYLCLRSTKFHNKNKVHLYTCMYRTYPLLKRNTACVLCVSTA